MAQSELGDVFKITLSFDDARVHDLTIQYFDTLPVATSLHITKHGLLLATSEVGDQCGFSSAVRALLNSTRSVAVAAVRS